MDFCKEILGLGFTSKFYGGLLREISQWIVIFIVLWWGGRYIVNISNLDFTRKSIRYILQENHTSRWKHSFLF